jgi:hypothetical protein
MDSRGTNERNQVEINRILKNIFKKLKKYKQSKKKLKKKKERKKLEGNQ